MSIRLIRNYLHVSTVGLRFQSHSVGGKNPPEYYRLYIYTAFSSAKMASNATNRMVVRTPQVSLTPDQLEAVKEANIKAQELFAAMQKVCSVIPIDDLVIGDASPNLFSHSIAPDNGSFARGYLTAKTEDAIFNGVRIDTGDSSNHTSAALTQQSIDSTSAEASLSGARETIANAAESGIGESAMNTAPSVGGGMLETVGSILSCVAELFGGSSE